MPWIVTADKRFLLVCPFLASQMAGIDTRGRIMEKNVGFLEIFENNGVWKKTVNRPASVGHTPYQANGNVYGFPMSWKTFENWCKTRMSIKSGGKE